MRAIVLNLNKRYEQLNVETLSYSLIITILLLACAVCGTEFRVDRAVLMERKETVHEAKSVVMHNDHELLASIDFKVEPLESEVKAEMLKPMTETMKPTTETLEPAVVLPETETIGFEKLTRSEEMDEPVIAIPVMSYKGNLRTDYCTGSVIDLSELELLLDENVISLEECMIEGLDTMVPGEYVANITYGEHSVEIPYTVIDYEAVLHGAGEEIRMHLVNYELDAGAIGIPERLGKEFTGWYRDEECTIPFVAALPGEIALDLYAGWKDFDRFACDDAGYITGYTGAYGSITDGLLNLTAHPSCIGIRADAFVNLEEFVTDIYIPANITNIESGAFDCLPYVFYIYVHPDNPAYSSDAGILYTKDMSTVVAYPSCR